METCNQKESELIATILWIIWKSRNERIFERTKRGAEQMCKYGQRFLQEYQATQTMKMVSMGYQNQPNLDSGWKPPAEDHLKLNVDAAFIGDRAGIGLVVRDFGGKLEAHMIENIPYCSGPEHAEIIGFWKALDFAKEFGIRHLELEGDALYVVKRINNAQPDLSMTGHLIAGIRNLAKDFPSLKINHIRRNLNKPAHEAASLALNSLGRNVC